MKTSPPRWRYAALLCFAFLVVTQKARAQVETDTTFRYQMNTIFGPLDKSKVSNGILRDYNMKYNPGILEKDKHAGKRLPKISSASNGCAKAKVLVVR